MPIRHPLDIATLVLLAFGTLYAAALFGLAPRDPARGVAVVFAPWTSQAQALERAARSGGRLMRLSGLPFIVVVAPDGPDYVARVRAEGALMVLDPAALAGCLTPASATAWPTS
jgi:hypothetical protein